MAQGTTKGGVNILPIDATPTDGSSNAVSSNGVFDALALKQNIVSGVSDTEIGYLDGVTSAIQTQLNNRVKTLINDLVSSSSLTGSTSETLLKSYLIPANTLTGSDIITMQNVCIKTGANNFLTVRFRHNTISSLSGASLLASNQSTAGNINIATRRRFSIKSGNICGLLAASLVPDDNLNSSSAQTVVSFDVAVDNYLIVTAQLQSALDSVVLDNTSIIAN